MELRGEVRRGYFVAGLSGVQFALPEAVERLRERASQLAGADALIPLVAVDPALIHSALAGLPLPFSRVPSTHVVVWRGQPVLVAEDNGERLTAPDDLPPELIRRALEAYLARPNAPRRMAVAQWNAAPILGSPGQALLQQFGFTRTPSGMERWVGA
jgi:ATP-dependent Lhr-like helicase